MQRRPVAQRVLLVQEVSGCLDRPLQQYESCAGHDPKKTSCLLDLLSASLGKYPCAFLNGTADLMGAIDMSAWGQRRLSAIGASGIEGTHKASTERRIETNQIHVPLAKVCA